MQNPPKNYHVNIVGYMLAFVGEDPVLTRLPNTNDMFVPLFATVENLETVMDALNQTNYDIVEIVDTREFLDSIPPFYNGYPLRIIINPRNTDDGTIRFEEILRYIN